MEQTRLGGMLQLGLVVGVLSGQPALAEKSRFMSYDSRERDCSSGGILSSAVCHSAFANARAEFEAKTGSFPSLPACAKVYGSCAVWPPGSSGRASYRPEWGGVDIVDTPQEKSVTPAVARGAKRLTFAARSLMAPDESERELLVRGARRSPPGPAAPPGPQRSLRAGHEPEPALAPGKPGGGFTMQDGVLTFPAPARFAPGALPKAP